MQTQKPGILWKVIPGLLVLLVIVAGGTDFFTANVRAMVTKVLQDFGASFLPFAISCIVGILLVSIANHLNKPLLHGLHRLVESTTASQRSKDLLKRLLQGFYWLVVGFMVLSIVAPHLLGTILSNLVLFGAAVVVALQDMAKDVAGGFVLQFGARKKCNIGDKIQLVGLDLVTGVVLEIDLLTTRVKTDKGVVTVPNREMWARSIVVFNPPPSPIILPPGVEWPKPPATPEPSKTENSNPLGLPGLFLFGQKASDDEKKS
jgi:small-conductance mechanosensitive channel